jgi:hypothetical protein
MSRLLKERLSIGEYTFNAKTGPIVSQVPALVDVRYGTPLTHSSGPI